MKKALLILSVVLLASLCACNKDSKPDSHSLPQTTTAATQTKPATTLPQRIEHIAQKLKEGRLESFDGYSDEEKEQIKQAVENDGYTLEFNADGSGSLSNEEGEWTVAAGWVKNEYTEGVPEVDFANVTMSFEGNDSKGDYYMLFMRQASYLEVENYVETLCQAGFDKIETKALNQEGQMIVFEAENKLGKRIEIGYSSNGFSMELYK